MLSGNERNCMLLQENVISPNCFSSQDVDGRGGDATLTNTKIN